MSNLDECRRTVTPKINRLPFGKRRRLDKFYKQQCDLLENFENDSRQIQDFQKNRRSVRVSSSEDAPQLDPEAQLLARDEIDDEDMAELAAQVGSIALPTGTKVHPVPRITLCESYEDMSEEGGTGDDTNGRNSRDRRDRSNAHYLAIATLFVNISLTLAKAVASYLSGSLSIISSLVDSLVDITSGLVIWLTSRAIRKHDPYLYPVGRTRLEPLALTIVSVIMAVASVQMIVQSLESIIYQKINPHVDLPTFCIMIATIFVKFTLFMLCRKFRDDPSAQVLCQDHRNDCFSNAAALICAFCAQKFWIYFDPLGAIAVAVYIAVTWFITGKEQLVMLSGKTAEPEFINRIIKVCIDHDDRIDYIDTVYVYHFGTRFLVEVHIVLDENMPLKDTHDISESLQNNIESLEEVERAFVHADYEFEHKPADEHKKVDF